MKAIITEEHFGNKTVYHRKKIDNRGNVISDDVFICNITIIDRMVQTSKHSRRQQTDILITDRDDHARHKPCYYVNQTLACSPINTRLSSARALQLFYTFCDMRGFDPETVDYTEVEMFVSFLAGALVAAENGRERDLTYRNADSINKLMAHLRKFFEALRIGNSEFVVPRGNKKIRFGQNKDGFENVRCPHSLKHPSSADLKTPPHFTPEEVRRIFEVIIEKGNVTDYILAKLEFSYGLRPGEVTGITTEDLKSQKREDGTMDYYIVLRNRCSDKDQFCKRLMHPHGKNDYHTELYKSSFATIAITKDTFDELKEYYRVTRNVSRKQLVRILEKTKADSVEGGKDNHYLFINSRGRAYTSHWWTERFKMYIEECGFQIDNGKRKLGSAHRLRHSYIMYLAYYTENPLDSLKIMELARHACRESLKPYLTPTSKEIGILQAQFEQNIKKFIPEIKTVLKNEK